MTSKPSSFPPEPHRTADPELLARILRDREVRDRKDKILPPATEPTDGKAIRPVHLSDEDLDAFRDEQG